MGSDRDEVGFEAFELGKNIGKTLTLPAALLLGDAHLREDASLLKPLSNPNKPYTAFLRLPIDGQGVILLLAPATPHTDLPLTRIFKPVMEILAKAIMLCRDHEAYTSGLISQRDVAWEGLRRVNRALRALTAGNEAMARVQTEEALIVYNGERTRYFSRSSTDASARNCNGSV